MTRPATPAPYFAFQAELRAVPSSPTHCVGCGTALELLRRYAGLCQACVAGRKFGPAKAPSGAPCFVLVGEHYRRNVSGRRERYAEVRCSCGRTRRLKWDTWANHRPACCNRCRLRAVEAHGFEAEFTR